MSKKKKLWIILSIVAGILLIGVIVLYCMVPTLIKNYLNRKIESVETERNVTLSMGDMEVTGFSIFGDIDLSIKDLHVKDNRSEVEFATADEVSVDVKAWRGFRVVKDVRKIELKTLNLNVLKHGDTTNYAFLKVHKDKKKSSSYNERVARLLDKLARTCPDEMECAKVNIRTDIEHVVNTYAFDNLQIDDGKLSGKFTVLPGEAKSSEWRISGVLDNKNKDYFGEIALADPKAEVSSIPLGTDDDGENVQFRKASGHLKLVDETHKQLRMELSGDISELQVYHHFIATQPVVIEHTNAKLNLTFTDKRIQVDSTSSLCLNQAVVHPFVIYEKSKGKKKHVVFKIDEKKVDAQKLFASLPEGLFDVVPHLSVRGNLDLHFLFDCDFAQLDSLKFDFDIRSRDHSFRIVEGGEYINRFNDSFEYVFYENGDTSRTAWIGPENPYFCNFSQVPNYLVKSILASEDAGFFGHRGFIKSSIQSALISNMKSGKLRRGGSTISQQLVKNLFLNRKKVFSRKIEEMLLVWMIEDYRMLTKERMFEIYVNIAEWGPGIIGIGEASEFYFGKRPSELTFGESLYLATLIRAPKHYRSTVNADGSVSDNKRAELEATSARMVERGIITDADLQNFDANVVIRMPAE